MAEDAEEQITAQPPYAAYTTENMSKQLKNMKQTLEKMTESQNKAHVQMETDARIGCAQRLVAPPMNSGIFESDLGRGSRIHIDALGRSPRTPSPTAPRRAVAHPQYFEHQQPGYGMPASRPQRLYTEEQQERDRAAAERAAQVLSSTARPGTRSFSASAATSGTGWSRGNPAAARSSPLSGREAEEVGYPSI
ncbi:hypothetical protein PInf_022292 [Phytophthora infestans]|nr:hypothetical protein PInf_022292 [Phytophthora infestans]